MEEAPEPEAFEEVDAVPVLAEEAGALMPTPSAGAGVVVARQAAAVAATSFAAGVVTVAAVRAGRAVRARRRARRKASHLPPVLATRSFLIDVHLLGSRDQGLPALLLICGSLRDGSTNAAALRTALTVAPEDVACRLYDGLDSLPHFNPDDDWEPLPPAVVELRAQIDAADAVLFCTPEYAGALPGSFKNLLDWTVGGGEMYAKPVAWINASGLPTGAADAHASLRKVLGYLSTEIVEDACVHVPVPRPAVGDDGLIGDPRLRARIADALTTLAGRSTHAR